MAKMKFSMRHFLAPSWLGVLGLAFLVAGCAGPDVRNPPAGSGLASGNPPVLTCEQLAAVAFPQLESRAVVLVGAEQKEAAGSQGQTISHGAFCKLSGELNRRVSPVDGKTYAIGFEMRFPAQWNGRFFHQTKGGLDGMVAPAVGDIQGGGQASSALSKGFVVLSSNAGHVDTRSSPISGGLFGIDPQARQDYGYQAVASLTPMAKALIRAYYGKAPDRSYVVGTSNGGRHAMVAASRLADQYDGYLVSAPGFNLPKAAAAQLWGAQQFATISPLGANGRPDVAKSFTVADTKLIAERVLAVCDGLDGAVDGMVFDTAGCQRRFDPLRDIPQCAGTSDGTCLSAAQKTVLARVHAGASLPDGQPLYASFPWSEGIHNNSSSGWRTWKFVNATAPRDPLAMAFVFMTPPMNPSVMHGGGTSVLDFALNWDDKGFRVDRDAKRIYTTDATYRESAMSFMTPPDPVMKAMVARGGRMIVLHGVADPVFSANDTIAWYEQFKVSHGRAATDSARLYLVPGMGHSRGGPATDQFDFVDALVDWVEAGVAPEAVLARARGKGGATLPVNEDVPAGWSPDRTRPLCPYPTFARYLGAGDMERAQNFECR